MDELADRIVQFLSTLPARGATLGHLQPLPADVISIHAPREGSDTSTPAGSSSRDPFLSTLPARGATDLSRTQEYADLFLSTLPARGATWMWSAPAARKTDFYPRSPRGERRS